MNSTKVMREEWRKEFEEEIMKNWGEAFQDFTPWGANSGNSLPPSEFQYANDGTNMLWLMWCAAKQQSEWISVDDRLPETKYEIEEFESDGENCFFHGFASQSIEISDGHNLARGHYRDDGTWCIYDAQHDFQLVDQGDITHWKALPEPPTNTQEKS